MTIEETPPCAAGSFHAGRASSYVVPILFCIVIAGGVAIRFQGEIFPIANWGMFSQVPSKGIYYSLLVHEVDGKPLQALRLVTDLPEFQAAFDTRAAIALIKQFCQALDEANAAGPEGYKKLTTLRVKVEALFGRREATYEPVQFVCDPLEFCNRGTTEKEATYGRFTTGAPLSEAQVREHTKEYRAPGHYRP